jgi:hypothetical protein
MGGQHGDRQIVVMEQHTTGLSLQKKISIMLLLLRMFQNSAFI